MINETNSDERFKHGNKTIFYGELYKSLLLVCPNIVGWSSVKVEIVWLLVVLTSVPQTVR